VTTFVLVHGAMHGGWCWRDVAPILRDAGHEVWTPTLTGQGERAHLLTPAITVQTHIQDIVNVVEYNDLDDLTLVFHSYSGGLAGPVIAQLAPRVRSVVLAGGFIQYPGESNFDVEPASSREMFEALASQYGDGWRIPVVGGLLERWGITDTDLAAELNRKLTDFSLAFSRGVVDYDPAPLATLPRTYIEHTSPPLPPLALSIERAKADGWTMRTISTGHDMMLTDPQGTAALLLDSLGTPS
jgi:pimeloyl-ACP methyl ester carboxylesterase